VACHPANSTSWPLGAAVGGKPRHVSFGTVASGEKVIANPNFVRLLLSQDRTIIGIEMESYGISAAVHGRRDKLLLIRGISDFADENKNDDARLSAMEGAMRFFNEAMHRGFLKPRTSGIVLPRSQVHSRNYYIAVRSREQRDGVINNYVDVTRKNKAIGEFRYRKSVIDKIVRRFNLGELRIFCISLKLDFDDIRGETKTEKAAGILEYVERKGLLTVEELEQLIEEE
jgi:hypothetical protein